MTEPHVHHQKFPRGALVGAALLIGLTIAVVAGFRIAGVAPVAQVPPPDETVMSRSLRFEDRPNGDVAVYEFVDGGPDRLIRLLEPGGDGFIRGVLRSLARARRASDIGRSHPFRLTLQADGRLLLEDPATSQRIFLHAFGPTNVETFRKLLAEERPKR